MEEVELLIRSMALYHLFCQDVVLFLEYWNIFFSQGIVSLRRCDYRLYAYLLEAQVSHRQDVLREVEVISGVGSSDIVLLS